MADKLTPEEEEKRLRSLEEQNITLKEMVSHYEKIARSAGKLKDEDKPSRTITSTYDGEIIYRFKHNDKLK